MLVLEVIGYQLGDQQRPKEGHDDGLAQRQSFKVPVLKENHKERLKDADDINYDGCAHCVPVPQIGNGNHRVDCGLQKDSLSSQSACAERCHRKWECQKVVHLLTAGSNQTFGRYL